ncbi:DUF3825 domain-containing protein [Bittarella massiliensis (ex Durand et al. 2017)]|uniref:DUF3825 domain-containing protein n=1 Tax=Bittarella massiliensis (ex Durand et al. 2017) TaxID=1720313 RepID=UPI001AA1A4E1|nr:DUF3825 domain-containing protein [Bittarella massiliensis (ex Durand et al. 2017)]MBO1678482.1 DUF3825 domain-containing protein [Bittarella massiliensis (ex Durand et al. 2017)]
MDGEEMRWEDCPLERLIDREMVRFLAKRLQAEEEPLFERLCAAYEIAKTEGSLRREGESLAFSLDSGVEILLVKNSNPAWDRPCYLKYHIGAELQPEAAALSEEVRGEIYRLLTGLYPFGEPIPLAQASSELIAAGYTKASLGVYKMKSAFEQLGEFAQLLIREEFSPPVVEVVLRPCPRYEGEGEQDLPAPPAGPEPVDAPEERPLGGGGERPLPEGMEGNIFLTKAAVQNANYLLTGLRGGYLGHQQTSQLMEGYRTAYQGDRIEHRGDAWFFDTTLTGTTGEGVFASFKEASPGGSYGWYVNWVGYDREKSRPGDELGKFAYLGNMTEFLRALAQMALPERWSFSRDNADDYSILVRYIKYTFYRLKQEGKVCILEREGRREFAAFNTGLVDRTYEEIYACFLPNAQAEKTPWAFDCFCTAGSRGAGKRLVDSFNPLPQAASYFRRKEDLLYDLDRELILDRHHIIVDNVNRLPLDFLEEVLYDSGEMRPVLCGLREGRPGEQKALYDQLRAFLDSGDKHFRRICSRVDEAVELAKKRVRWNFKTALPCFFPTRNVMSLMLPLALLRDDRVDLALVVELTQSGNYQGQTILPLREAYIDARLLCRPDSDWLDTSAAAAAGEED